MRKQRIDYKTRKSGNDRKLFSPNSENQSQVKRKQLIGAQPASQYERGGLALFP
jgi:hypothetical protein